MTKYKNILSISVLLTICFSMNLSAGHDQLGVQTHYAHKGWEPLSTISSIKDLGVGWIRDDIFWGSVEKEKGKYEIPEYTWEWINNARTNDLKIILVLTGKNSLYEDPFDHDGYVNFARFVAQEMKGHVQAIELINEPFGHFRIASAEFLDGNCTWNGWDPSTQTIDPWVKKYLNTMNDMADAINEVAPDEYAIVGLGCAPPLNKHMLNIGVSTNIDGIALHPYSYDMPPEHIPYGDTPSYCKRDGIKVGDKAGNLIAMNADLLKTAGSDGPQEMWLTEQGYTTFQPTGYIRHYDGYTESAQAKYAQRRLMECLGTNVRLASWYNFYSKGNRRNNSEDNFGIMRRDGSLKPAYGAIQRVATTMINWSPDNWGSIDVFFAPDRPKTWRIEWDKSAASQDEVRVYQFVNKENSHGAAIWSTEAAGGDMQPRTANIVISADFEFSEITALDMMSGEEQVLTFVRDGNKVTLEKVAILDYPRFVVLK